MARRTCDGAGLLAAFRAAADHLAAHVDEINGLNVFPVPDGDTGSNMVATMQAAVEEAERAAPAGADRIASAMSFGALMGARGNSGVITSQILRGLSEALAGKARFNGLDLAHGLDSATKTAYGAVGKPVEGTILTVIRESAAAARTSAAEHDDVATVLAAAVDGAAQSVARTPMLLAILREAGVVDSGGQGLFRLLEGALRHARGDVLAAPPAAVRPPARAVDVGAAETAGAHHGRGEDEDAGFGYETVFLLRARPGEALDVAATQAYLASIGESVVVAGDGSAAKVHVHNDRPDLVLAHGLAAGNLSQISVHNLDGQVDDVREARSLAFVGAAAPGPAEVGRMAAAASATPATTAPESAPEAVPSGAPNALAIAIVAVVPGDGLARIFRDELGVAVVRGGQSANPSTGELLEAVEGLGADEVVILPNNPNVILAAQQVARIAERPIHVVPTRNAAEGIAAMLAFRAGQSGEANVREMTQAARGIQTLSVTGAVRDATLGGRRVKRGEVIVLDPDDGLVASHRDLRKAVLAGVAALEPGFALVSLFYGDGADLAEAEGLARDVGGLVPGVEVEVRHGGQPHYRYLISAEA